MFIARKLSAPPLRSLRLNGELLVTGIQRRAAEAAEITQRKTGIKTLHLKSFRKGFYKHLTRLTG